MFLRGLIDRLTGDYSAVIDGDEDERFGVYGLFSRPRKGTKTIRLRRGDSVVIVGEKDDRITLELEDGEVALHDGFNRVHLKGKDGIVIDSPAGIAIGGESGQKLLTEVFQTWADTHVHAGNGTPPAVLSNTISGVTTSKVSAV